MTLEDFDVGDEVIYIPNHAHGDRTHEDCEWGRVTSKNEHYIFVLFNNFAARFGKFGGTSQACKPENLER